MTLGARFQNVTHNKIHEFKKKGIYLIFLHNIMRAHNSKICNRYLAKMMQKMLIQTWKSTKKNKRNPYILLDLSCCYTYKAYLFYIDIK